MVLWCCMVFSGWGWLLRFGWVVVRIVVWFALLCIVAIVASVFVL